MTETVYPSERRRLSVVDVLVTMLFVPAALVVAALAFWMSLWFAAITDSCVDRCNDIALTAAYGITWGGIALGLVVMSVGVIWSLVTGRLAFYWPLMSIAATVVGFGFAAVLLEQV